MHANLFKSLLSIDIICLYPPFPISLPIPGCSAPISRSDALYAWRGQHVNVNVKPRGIGRIFSAEEVDSAVAVESTNAGSCSRDDCENSSTRPTEDHEKR